MMDIWIAPKHVYCDKDGNIVDQSHPDCHKILIGKGDAISMARAISLGLVEALIAAEELEADSQTGEEPTDYALLTKSQLIEVLTERGITDFKPADKKELLVSLCERTEPPKTEEEE